MRVPWPFWMPSSVLHEMSANDRIVLITAGTTLGVCAILLAAYVFLSRFRKDPALLAAEQALRTEEIRSLIVKFHGSLLSLFSFLNLSLLGRLLFSSNDLLYAEYAKELDVPDVSHVDELYARSRSWTFRRRFYFQAWKAWHIFFDFVLPAGLFGFSLYALRLLIIRGPMLQREPTLMAIFMFVGSFNLWVVLRLLIYLKKLATIADTDSGGLRLVQAHLPSTSQAWLPYFRAKLAAAYRYARLGFQADKACQYQSFTWTLYNSLQVVIMMIEFWQLISYPLSDLLGNLYFQEQTSSTESIFSQISSFFRLGIVRLDTPFLSTMQFIVGFYLILIGAAIAAFFTLFYYAERILRPRRLFQEAIDVDTASLKRRMRHWTWRASDVFAHRIPALVLPTLVTLVTVGFLPVLSTYLRVLKCQMDWQTPEPGADPQRANLAAQLCYEFVVVNPKTYVWAAAAAYGVFYVLASVFLTSYEGRYTPGLIAFTPASVVMLKNGSLLLVLDYFFCRGSLIFRACLSVGISLYMIAYNIAVGSCAVASMNKARTAIYTSVLWANMVISYVSLPSQALLMLRLGRTVYLILGVGWFFSFALAFAMHRRALSRLPDDPS